MRTDDLSKTITGDRVLGEKFLTWVYPAGAVNGDWFVLGDFKGSAGESAAIRLPGLYGTDNSNNETVSGPVSILKKTRGCNNKTAIEVLQEWATNEGVNGAPDPEKADLEFPWEAAVASVTEDNLQELAEFRGFTLEQCRRIKEAKLIGRHKDHWVFPIYNTKGAVIAVDMLMAHPHFNPGEKQKWSPEPKGADRQKSWFRIGSFGSDTAVVVITESRWDALSIFNEFEGDLGGGVILATSLGVSQVAAPIPKSHLETVLIFRQSDEPSQKWTHRVAARVLSVQADVRLQIVEPVVELEEGELKAFKDYNELLRQGFSIGDAIDRAKEYALVDGEIKEDERPVYKLPGDYVEAPGAAKEAFRLLGATGEIFNFQNRPYRLVKGKDPKEQDESSLIYSLQPIARTVRLVKDRTGELICEPALPSTGLTALILASEFHKDLPKISRVLEYPSLLQIDGKLVVAGAGYHQPVGGDCFILKDADPLPKVSLNEAVRMLLDLIKDFEFQNPADRSRMMGFMIAPALQTAGFLNGAQYPLCVLQATFCGSGKTSLMETVYKLYRETPATIAARDTKRSNGVGSFDNSLSAAIMRGRRFLTIDNQRGELDSTLLEDALTAGEIQARASYSEEAPVDTTGCIFMLTSNNARLGDDLMDRAIFVNLRGEPKKWSMNKAERDAMLQRDQPKLLSAVYAIVSEWHRQGCPKGKKAAHRFADWSEAVCGVVEETCGLDEMLKGMEDDVQQATDPVTNWARKVAVAVDKQNELGVEMFAADITKTCQVTGIWIPGTNERTPEEQLKRAVGQLLGRLAGENCAHVRLGPYVMKPSHGKVSRPDGRGLAPRWSATFEEVPYAN